MSQTVVKASVGRELGTRPSRRLRAEGMLPGVVYGLDKEPQTVAVRYTDLRDALNTATGMNTVFQLDVDGSPETVLVRAVQRDPIKRVVTHADFMRVDPEKPIKLKVPIRLIGDGTAVTSNGGMIEQKMFQIEVQVSPDAIPNEIVADLGMLTLDRRITVGDLDLPEGVSTAVAEEISVVSPVLSRAAKVGADLDDEFEDGEGEGEAEAADGEGEGGDDAGAADEGGE